jgi:hypothetical protein
MAFSFLLPAAAAFSLINTREAKLDYSLLGTYDFTLNDTSRVKISNHNEEEIHDSFWSFLDVPKVDLTVRPKFTEAAVVLTAAYEIAGAFAKDAK